MELTQEQRKQIESRFLGYISDYDPEDPKIRLKTDHSFRVAGLSERIAATEAAGLSGQAAAADTDMYGQAAAVDTDLAWLTGLLHDIGRFEQIRRYGTFVDARSVDHAALGADLLFQEGLLDRIAGPELASASEQTAGPELTAQEREALLDKDLTEAEGLDDLHAASGVIAEAEALAAQLWGSEECHFLVNLFHILLNQNLNNFEYICGNGNIYEFHFHDLLYIPSDIPYP